MLVDTKLNVGWLLGCSALVFIMQVGFCCLETGLVRTKNSINVAIKNLVDVCLAGFLFWLWGYALMFGDSLGGVVGASEFLFEPTDAASGAYFIFQLMFCGAATTIVAGAVAERMRFAGYIIVSAVIGGLVYPVFGHWAWAPDGWLYALGFRDFAGSIVVHSTGAWIALAACLILGPRHGRFDKGHMEISGHNLPLATIGVMILWFGWFGFNAGSQLTIDESTPGVVGATTLAAMAGGLTALAVAWAEKGLPDALQLLNGILAGLVSITASCCYVSFSEAVAIGAIGGVIAVLAVRMIAWLRVDDAVSAIAVHGCAGVWGAVALALAGSPSSWGTGLNRTEQLLVQLLGVSVCFAWSFGVGFVVLWLVNSFYRLRVTAKEERMGLNIAEHAASTETHELVTEMDHHRTTGDFSRPVSVESHSEIGQIAAQYNRVLSVVNEERAELVDANRRANAANADLREARAELEQKLQELHEFNDVAVDRELRMMDLKTEINDLAERIGETPPYAIDGAEFELASEGDAS